MADPDPARWRARKVGENAIAVEIRGATIFVVQGAGGAARGLVMMLEREVGAYTTIGFEIAAYTAASIATMAARGRERLS